MSTLHDDDFAAIQDEHLNDDRADYEAWCEAQEEAEWWALQEAQALEQLRARKYRRVG